MKASRVIAALCVAFAAPAFATAAKANGLVVHRSSSVAAPSGFVLRSAKRPPILAGSAGERARRLARTLRPAVFPAAPLFVADPAMNAVVVYDSTLTGTVTPNMIMVASGANKLNVPVAVTAGFDCIPTCGQYLWVSNVGNNSVTAYSIPLSPTSTPIKRFRAKPTCSNAISLAYGIAHAKATLFITNEGTNAITVWKSKDNLKKCPIRTIVGASTQLAAPSGPSVSFPTNASTNYVFNANSGAVTGFGQLQTGNVAPSLVWNTGGAATEGTATDWNLGYLWLTSNANTFYTADAIWLCTGLPLPGVCPTIPQITGTSTGLNFPDFPSVSTALSTVFVPNQNGGTVTEYPESGSGNIPPVATFTGLTNPIGTAIENAPD